RPPPAAPAPTARSGCRGRAGLRARRTRTPYPCTSCRSACDRWWSAGWRAVGRGSSAVPPGTASAPGWSVPRWSRCSLVVSLTHGGLVLGVARAGVVLLLAHAPLLVVAVQVDTELTLVALRAQLLHVGVELLLRDADHVEEHVGVVLAAQLGALAGVDALAGRRDLEGVGVARHHVLLVQEVHDPEGMDDVTGVESELDGLVHGQVQRRQRVGGPRLAGDEGLHADGLVDVVVDVVDVPAPLLGHDV